MKRTLLLILCTCLLVAPTACLNATVGGSPGNGDGVDPVDASTNPVVDAAVTPDARVVPDAAPLACDGGTAQTVGPTGVCYMYFADVVTWEQARLACEALPGDAHLATSTDQAENDLLFDLGPTGAEDIWMGGNDLEVEGAWIWITGESMADYDNWRINEPNSPNEPNDGNGGTSEECMVFEIDRPLGSWDDRPCDRVYSYFCERAP